MSETTTTTPQIALVTGATRGIGAAIAAELAERGYRVIGTATSDDGAARINDVLSAKGGKGVKLDVTDGAEVGLRLRARGQDYAFEVTRIGADGEVATLPVAVADGRTLDSVATGGFLGLWVGVYATSEGRETQSQATVGPLTYEPR